MTIAKANQNTRQAATGISLPTGSAGFALTDYGNAERLAARHGHDLRYLTASRQWLCWDGVRWQLDGTGIVIDLPPENRSSRRVRAALAGKGREVAAKRKRYGAEEIIGKLREAEVGLAQGQSVGQVVRKLGVSEQTYYRWRREYGGLRVDQAKRFKELERENTQLKKIVAEQALDNAMLRELSRGNF
jgi:transposase-like protein